MVKFLSSENFQLYSIKLTIAVVAEATVRGSGGPPYLTRCTPLQLDLLTLDRHCLITSRGTHIPLSGVGRIYGTTIIIIITHLRHIGKEYVKNDISDGKSNKQGHPHTP